MDPFSQVLDRLWTIVTAHAPLASVIRAGNRINYLGARADKDQRQDGDLPELRIVPTALDGLSGNRQSGAQRMDLQFSFEVATGRTDVDGTGAVLPILWELLRALYRYESQHGSTLGLSFVIQAQYSSAAIALDPGTGEQTSGRRQWVKVLTLTVQMQFNRATQLVAESPAI